MVAISRVAGALTLPANFMLIGAMNPCPCGYFGDPVKECTCSMRVISRYQKRISGPLLDRIHIHIEVLRVEYEKLSDDRFGERSAAIRARVEAARQRQRQRFAGSERLMCNGDMGPAEIREVCVLEDAGKGLLRAAMQQLHLTARAYHRILKLARTIADLAGSPSIETAHLAEAIQYRASDSGEARFAYRSANRADPRRRRGLGSPPPGCAPGPRCVLKKPRLIREVGQMV